MCSVPCFHFSIQFFFNIGQFTSAQLVGFFVQYCLLVLYFFRMNLYNVITVNHHHPLNLDVFVYMYIHFADSNEGVLYCVESVDCLIDCSFFALSLF